ncbi:uroporphyrinogen-III synthase [Nitriliruptor alkaliphilus]|uniref:uroporphyrinogen-III synthase n=1 Tax=Nitriliruptor alkaliphilus TaxID=427918 RepID=UPI0006983208|nr:uroporphyrinogen-III synthase [Nitriliruptor alkaliphilus]
MATTSAHSPLARRRVLVTRPPHQVAELVQGIRLAGGEPVLAPTIATVPGDTDALIAAAHDLAAGVVAGACFTSANGVHAFARGCDEGRLDRRGLLDGLTLVGAVGPRTAELVLETFGRAPTVVPDTSTGAALGAAVPPGSGEVLLPRGDLAADDLDRALRRRGWTPRRVDAYRTVTAPSLPGGVLTALAAGEVDLLAFTSASTVRGFVELVGDRPWSGRVVAIGPVTAAACRELGLTVAEQADPHDLDGLLVALGRAAEVTGGRTT